MHDACTHLSIFSCVYWLNPYISMLRKFYIYCMTHTPFNCFMCLAGLILTFQYLENFINFVQGRRNDLTVGRKSL
jgi:hypothetical protein